MQSVKHLEFFFEDPSKKILITHKMQIFEGDNTKIQLGFAAILMNIVVGGFRVRIQCSTLNKIYSN